MNLLHQNILNKVIILTYQFSSKSNISTWHEYCGIKFLQLDRYVNQTYKIQ
jgi:hypothetical protein